MNGVPFGAEAPTSLLFIPGDKSTRYVASARAVGSSAVILDIEDSVAPERKDLARAAIEVATTMTNRMSVLIRVNAPSTAWLTDDLELVLRVRPDAVVVPKAEDASVIQALSHMLARRGDRPVPIIAMIETPAGVLAAAEVSRADGVIGLALGGEDLTASLRAVRTAPGRELLLAKQMVLLAARARGIWAFDTVSTEVPAGRRTAIEAVHACRAGFDGKLALHPSQVPVVDRAYAPTELDVADATRIVKEFDDNMRLGKGVIRIDDRMIDLPVVARARLVLSRASRSLRQERTNRG